MTPNILARHALAALAAVFLIFGCSGGSPSGPNDDDPVVMAADLVRIGWQRFQAGQLAEARTFFEMAAVKDPTLSEAPLGLGWTRLRQRQLAEAMVALDRAADLGEASLDLSTARAILARESTPADWSEVLSAVDRVQSASPTYQFAYDASFDWRDLRLLAGQSAFALGDYARARAEVVALGGPALDPYAPDFVMRLLEALDALFQHPTD